MEAELILPHSIEAEQALLGAIFLDNEVMVDVEPIVPSYSLFYRHAHQCIYSVMLEIRRDGSKEIDWITVAASLRAKSLMEVVGGEDYLETITAAAPMAEGAEQYAELVRDKWILRQAIESTTLARSAAYQPSADAKAIREKLRETVDVLDGITDRTMPDMQRVIENVRKTVAEVVKSGDIPSWRTGNIDFDEQMLGWQVGGITALAAPSGGGKTFTALSFCQLFQEANEGLRAGIISLRIRLTPSCR